jgi:zinc protease
MNGSLLVVGARVLRLVSVSVFLGPLVLASPSVLASPVAAVGAQPVKSVEGVHEYRLPNGLQVLLIPDDSKPTTTVNVTYRVGSRHESYGQTGMAHLLEHLLFKGSPKHPNVWGEFNKRGLRANGTTWFDRTNYFASFAANEDNLRWYLAWQADAMRNSFIARKDLDTEMTVVRNEMEMGENDPGRVLFEKTLATMYQWHNYGKSTIGARADVEGVDIAQLKAFYLKHYRPDNATLIVSGKFDPVRVLQWTKQFFGPIRVAGPKPAPQYTLDAPQDGERAVTLRRAGGTPLLYVGYHIMPGAHPDYAAIELLSLILSDTPSGRLHKALTEQQKAAGVFGFSQALSDPGFLLLGAQMSPGQDPDVAARELLKVAESVAQTPITSAELARAKAKWLKSWDMGFADPQQVGVDLSEAVAQGDWRLYFALRDRVQAIGLSDVQRVATQVLLPSNRTLGQYVPTATPARAPMPARVDVAQVLANFKSRPTATVAETFDASPANIESRTLRSEPLPGLRAALLPKTTRGQAVKASLVLRFGDEQTLRGWGQVPDALAALLDKGTQSPAGAMNRQQVQDRLDELQADVSFSAGMGQLRVDIDARRDSLPKVIQLIGQLLRYPLLPADVLEETRQQALASLEEQRKEPEALLSNTLARMASSYPKGDVRYVSDFDETTVEWREVDITKVKAFHQRFVGISRSEFSAVGDFDATAVQQALVAAFQGWTASSPFARVTDPWAALKPARVELPTPDKQNAVMQVLLPIPLNDQHPDFPALMLANHLFGAGGDSRLWNRIREKEGLSYNVYSAVQWNPWEAHSRWEAEAIFAPQNRDKVEQAFREELAKVIRDGFTQSEMEAGRKGLLNFRQLSRAQDGRLASAWASNLYLGRTFKDAERIDNALKQLTLAQVNQAIRQYIQPELLLIGFAGDFKKP